MRLYYVNNTDRTSDVEGKKAKITNQIQQRSDSCDFTLIDGSKPTEYQDLRIYDAAIVSSHSGTTIVLKESYTEDTGIFHAGQFIFLDIAGSIERAEIDSYTESTRTIELVSSPSVSMSDGDYVGALVFGGVVASVSDSNNGTVGDIIYKVKGVDYTKIFDKALISDTWQDVDGRYIINDFCNTTINYNQTLDNLSYENDSAIQAEWTDQADADNPTVDTSDYIEGTSSAVFSWSTLTGTATWAGTPTSRDLSDLLGASSGTPTKGELMFWMEQADHTKVLTMKIRVGHNASNYAELTYTPSSDNEWNYYSAKFTDATITGTPDWTAADYVQVRITQTMDSSIKMNGLRINANGSFTLSNVHSTPTIDELRSPRLKPTVLINQLAKLFEYVWYIDYERDIHYVAKETENAPLQITDTSNNYNDLQIEVDVSNLGNKIIVSGGEVTSSSTYAEVKEGDNAVREWLMKSKFKNLAITVDDNSSTDLMEAGTTTTNVTATAHGLSTGDHITNRTRGNVVRQITKVDDDNFTVEAVTGQTNGDTFSKFATSKTSGVEGLVDETTVDYVYNSNEKSVRATTSEDTLTSAEFIRFSYNERIPISVPYSDSNSIDNLKALGLGNGVFELDPIVDTNITDVTTARSLGQAKVAEFSNPIVTVKFKTDQKGLRAGQIIRIQNTLRGIDTEYVIQKITRTVMPSAYHDYEVLQVVAGTTLNGLIEFFQKLLRAKDGIQLNPDAVVQTYVDSYEEVACADVNTVAIGGINKVESSEDVDCSDSWTITTFNPPFKWEPNGVGQPINTRWNLFEWG